MLFVVSAPIGAPRGDGHLIGGPESTCGPAGHPTESGELRLSESPLQEELLPDVMAPLTAMVAAQRHRQAQNRAEARVRTGTGLWRWFWFGGFEAFPWRFGLPSGSLRFQQTAQSQI